MESGEGRWGGIEGLMANEKLFSWGTQASELEGSNCGLSLEEMKEGLSLV